MRIGCVEDGVWFAAYVLVHRLNIVGLSCRRSTMDFVLTSSFDYTVVFKADNVVFKLPHNPWPDPHLPISPKVNAATHVDGWA